jgi:hypothetical protein
MKKREIATLAKILVRAVIAHQEKRRKEREREREREREKYSGTCD